MGKKATNINLKFTSLFSENNNNNNNNNNNKICLLRRFTRFKQARNCTQLEKNEITKEKIEL